MRAMAISATLLTTASAVADEQPFNSGWLFHRGDLAAP
jgi:hypothetical protein